MRRSPLLLALSLVAAPLPAQVALTLRDVAIASGAGPGGVLLPAYELHLRSDWPQLTSTANAGCVNGGEEQLAGRLVQTSAGAYTGELERRTTILFCGVHGQVRNSCQLTLRSTGAVKARGEGRVVGSGAELRLRWSAVPGGGVPQVSGDCPVAFAEKVQQMYLAVVHGLELPLPAPGEAMRRVTLEDYGWVADIQGEDH